MTEKPSWLQIFVFNYTVRVCVHTSPVFSEVNIRFFSWWTVSVSQLFSSKGFLCFLLSGNLSPTLVLHVLGPQREQAGSRAWSLGVASLTSGCRAKAFPLPRCCLHHKCTSSGLETFKTGSTPSPPTRWARSSTLAKNVPDDSVLGVTYMGIGKNAHRLVILK